MQICQALKVNESSTKTLWKLLSLIVVALNCCYLWLFSQSMLMWKNADGLISIMSDRLLFTIPSLFSKEIFTYDAMDVHCTMYIVQCSRTVHGALPPHKQTTWDGSWTENKQRATHATKSIKCMYTVKHYSKHTKGSPTLTFTYWCLLGTR